MLCNNPATFPVGLTHVTCSATDMDGDSDPLAVVTSDFDVTVTPLPDTDLSISTVANLGPVAATGPLGAQVSFALPVATDEDGSVAVTCNPPSGSWFAPGTNTVTCSATDLDDTPSTVQTSFTVTVTDTDLAISAGVDPSPVVATIPTGAHVSFDVPVASDEDGSSVVVSCNPGSGSFFLVGKTTVTCSATDNDDSNSPVKTTLTVTVYAFPTVPSAPLNVTASSLDGGALVVFGDPWDTGGYPIDHGNASCTSSNGGDSGSASGVSPITVTGLTNGRTYRCTVTATNQVGTGRRPTSRTMSCPEARPPKTSARIPRCAR